MGLRETFGNVAKAGIRAVGNVALASNYDSYATSVYDASAGTASTTYASVHGVKVVFGEFSLVEIDGASVRRDDKKALIARIDLVDEWAFPIAPKAKDRIRHDMETEASTTWNVIAVDTDPAEALWVLQVRRAGAGGGGI